MRNTRNIADKYVFCPEDLLETDGKPSPDFDNDSPNLLARVRDPFN